MMMIYIPKGKGSLYKYELILLSQEQFGSKIIKELSDFNVCRRLRQTCKKWSSTIYTPPPTRERHWVGPFLDPPKTSGKLKTSSSMSQHPRTNISFYTYMMTQLKLMAHKVAPMSVSTTQGHTSAKCSQKLQ